MMFQERLRPLRPLKAQIFSFPSLKIIIRVRAALGTAPISGASSLKCCDWLLGRQKTHFKLLVPSCFYGKSERPEVSVDWKHGHVSCVSCTRHVFSFTCIVRFLFSSFLWPVIKNMLKKKISACHVIALLRQRRRDQCPSLPHQLKNWVCSYYFLFSFLPQV